MPAGSQVVLLRVGIDTGCGGGLAPIFADGTFTWVPIPGRRGPKFSEVIDQHGRPLTHYFKGKVREELRDWPVHKSPEWNGMTYVDPTRPKKSLARLEQGDVLVFYAGLKPWDFEGEPGLYIIGHFQVLFAGLAPDLYHYDLFNLFRNSAVWRPWIAFRALPKHLVLVKGSKGSRLLEKAAKISVYGEDSAGRKLHVLSPAAQEVFGDFEGKISIQRCPPRWVYPEFTGRAVEYILSL